MSQVTCPAGRAGVGTRREEWCCAPGPHQRVGGMGNKETGSRGSQTAPFGQLLTTQPLSPAQAESLGQDPDLGVSPRAQE